MATKVSCTKSKSMKAYYTKRGFLAGNGFGPGKFPSGSDPCCKHFTKSRQTGGCVPPSPPSVAGPVYLTQQVYCMKRAWQQKCAYVKQLRKYRVLLYAEEGGNPGNT